LKAFTIPLRRADVREAEEVKGIAFHGPHVVRRQSGRTR
jgi:hypothetical protein